MKKFTVELNYEELDRVIVEYLKEVYLNIGDDIDRLQNAERKLQNFEKQDLKHYLKYHKGLKRTLKYFMVHDDFVSFMENTK